VMTTVAAFMPLVLVPGRMGRFFSVIGVTAIVCLAFSLLESQLILPAHLAHRRTSSARGEPNGLVRRWSALQGWLSSGLERFARETYGSFLEKAIEYRYVTLAAALGIVLISASLFASGRLRYQFFPAVTGDTIYATLTMPQGAPLEVTGAAVRQIEASAAKLRDELDQGNDGPSEVLHVLSTIGRHQGRDGPPDMSVNAGGAHLAEVSIQLRPDDHRAVGSDVTAARWRELTGPVPDAEELSFSAAAFSAGEPIFVELRGGTIATLTRAAEALKGRLAGYQGVSDISDSFRSGKQEIKLRIRPEARPLGLTQNDLARQVRQAFYGEEVQRIQRGRDDVRVMLRYPRRERRSLGSLEEMRIRTVDGTEVPFASVADAEFGRGYATIRRTDRMRVVNVTADVDRRLTTPEAVIAEVERELPALLAAYPGVSYSLEGEQAEHGTALQGLLRGSAIAMLVIYALLAIPLRSYAQPLIIMSVIPFGAIGAVLGHLIMGWDVVFFSVLGIVALAGVVVNSSLVLVHYVNRRRDEGLPFLDAVSTAGVARFRPIFLTSLTTFIGLLPLMVESNLQAQMLIPMAISLGYGVLFSAGITLLLVPCLYVILDDLASLRTRRPQPNAEPLPAAGGG